MAIPVLATFRHGKPIPQHVDPTTAALYLGGSCLAGGLLIFDAYRRWCRTELG